jgi:broad specificity phosphatase PhoE
MLFFQLLFLFLLMAVLQPAMCFTVCIMRHGQTDANANEIEQGSADFSRLTDLGKEQASNAYQALIGTSITSVYTSPLTRARQTLEQLRKEDASFSQSVLPPSDRILNDLREIDQYDWQGQSYSELQRQFPQSWRAWQKGIPVEMKVLETTTNTVHYPLLEMWERADRVWNEILELEKQKNADDTMGRAVLIVAHGNLGQALLGSAMGWDASRFNDEGSVFGNCGMAEVEFDDLDTCPRKIATRWRWRWPVPSAWSSPTA